MGLFDNYGQQGYTEGGGLIDRLMQLTGAQAQYQPSAGFGGNPMDANAQQQAAPISVGNNYQMPRIGDASQFMPDPAAIPQNAQPAQGQQFAPMQAPQSQLPSILQAPGDGLGDRLMAGAKNFAGGGGLISGLVGGITGLATGQRTDPGGVAAENMRAQFKALVPILGEQKAILAVLNPALGQKLVEQATAGKQYAFTTAPDGTVIRTDAHAGTAEPVYQAGLKPTFGVVNEQDGQRTYGWIDPGKRTTTPVAPIEPRSETVTGPDGKQIAIPPGIDRKEFIKKVTDANAKAATGEKTEVQARSEKFGNKMELAERNLKDIEGEGASALGRMTEGSAWLPGSASVGRYAQSDNYQKYRQARDNFITALLRDESGAAIGTDEFNRYEKELFPQPGDGPAVIKQKREARRVAIEGMKKAAGPGYKSPNYDSETATADPLGIR